jgi:hypothetical protein
MPAELRPAKSRITMHTLRPYERAPPVPGARHRVAQSPPHTDVIRRVALDYIEGWYAGDAERMERSLHPDLVKRIVQTRDDRSTIGQVSAAEFIASTGRGGGSRTPADQRRTDITVLNVFENVASARVDADTWIDYMHLARFNGEWKIVNVLREIRR